PRSIDSPHTLPANGGNVDREVGDKNVVTVEYEAVRPEKADRRAVLVDASEVAELGDHPTFRRLEHHDLVRLIAHDPEIVVLVNDNAIGSAPRAVDENLGRAGLKWRAAHRDFNDRVLRGVGNEHRRLLVVERDAICADRGRWPCWLEE